MTQQELNDKLFEAVKNDDLDQVKELISNGADVNVRDEYGQTPLYFVQTAKIANLLIEHGADVNVRITGEYILRLILERYGLHDTDWEDEEIIKIAKLLIDNGADVNAKNYHDETPLEFAQRLLHHVTDKATQNLKFLVDYIKSNITNKKQQELNDKLFEAVENDDLDQVKELISDGADISAKDRYGCTPLHTTYSTEVAKLLIENDADVNAKSEEDGTPLHFAKNAEIAKLLIDHGADVNAKSEEGFTPLHCAAFNDHIEIVKLLIENGANVNTKDNYGDTPLDLARTEEIKKLLIEHGADEN